MTAANRGDELPQGGAARIGRTEEDIVSSGQQADTTHPAPVSRFPRIVVQDIRPLHGSSSLKAFASVLVGDILIKSCRIFQRAGKEANVVFPESKGTDGKWYSLVECINRHLMQEIERLILNAWERKLNP